MFEEMKRFRTPEAPPVDAARLGEELRDARLALGASIEDMAAQTRIRRVYLIALEEGRLKDLPSPAYAIGFVRNYAAALGLDVNDMVRRFREAASGRKQDLVFPEPVPERGFPTGLLVLLGAAIAIGSYITWYNWTGAGDRTVDAVPPPPPRLESAVREGEALRPEGPATLGAALAPPPAAPPSPSLPVPTPVPVQVPPAAPAQSGSAAVGEGRMVIRARGEAWVQVRDPRTNQNLFARVMRPGESWTVPADRTGLLLSTGAAQNIDVLVDGQVSQVFAATQGVRRDVPLNPAELRNRPAPAAPAAAPASPPAAPPRPPATPAAPPAAPAAAPPPPARLPPSPSSAPAGPPQMGRP
ncbi:MAG: DUF4115 domain-containing protein [Roseococcus sp.]|nr:DUF4115 domain-containing protein [Roseococcus sp.]